MHCLDRLVPTPAEILCSGIGLAAKTQDAEGILKAPEVAKLSTMCARWHRDFRRSPKLARKMEAEKETFFEAAQTMHEWLRAVDSSPCDAELSLPPARALVHLGFQSWCDLDSASADLIKHTEGISEEMNALANRGIALATAQGDRERRGTKRNFQAVDACIVAEQVTQQEDAVGGQPTRPWPREVGTLLGPRQSCKVLAQCISDGISPAALTEKIRIDAIINSAPKSLPRFASGLRCWGAFAEEVLELKGKHLPPTAEGLIASSRCFKHPKTFQKYIASVQFGCEYAGLPTDSTYDKSLRRARAAVAA